MQLPVRGGVRAHEYAHPFSQIVAISDAYDAIVAARVYYKVPTPPDQGVRIMLKKRGTAFHPVLVKAFVNMIGLFPVGTMVKLDTGEVGLVGHAPAFVEAKRLAERAAASLVPVLLTGSGTTTTGGGAAGGVAPASLGWFIPM